MANAFSLTGDYHVNEVIGPANTLGQAGKSICSMSIILNISILSSAMSTTSIISTYPLSSLRLQVCWQKHLMVNKQEKAYMLPQRRWLRRSEMDR